MTFRRYIEEQKNTHMEHAEDALFLTGASGARSTLDLFHNLRKDLRGHSKQDKNLTVTVKWDGAPAIFAGIDPRDGKFFVAKKSVFNKTPKVYKTPADIEQDTLGDLAFKLKAALRLLPETGIKGVIQGDFMFSKNDLKFQTHEGVEYVMFHPNTIVYAVPKDTDLGRKILRSEIGIVWHTVYEGTNFENMRAVFGKDISKRLVKTPAVWMADATFEDATGVALLTTDEDARVVGLLQRAEEQYKNLNLQLLDEIATDQKLAIRIMRFNNKQIRAQRRIDEPSAYTYELMRDIERYFDQEIADRKTPRGKEDWQKKKYEMLKYFTQYGRNEWVRLFEYSKTLIEIKEILISQLNKASTMKTFLRTKRGLRVTNPEGFVAIDHIGNVVKLVDRLEFSHANFSDEIIKGWK